MKKLKKVISTSQSILNGLFGDNLANSFLEVKMGFYHQGEEIHIDASSIKTYFSGKESQASPKVCLLIHGLTHNETAWDFPDKTNYGTFFERDFNFSSFSLRYNTGLHISENGKKLASLLEEFYKNYPIPIEEISIIAHSMGGLITHSACHYANQWQYHWQRKLQTVFLIATPHKGSFLEQFANLTTNVLSRVPNWHTRLVGRIINLRSAGIKDLRFAYLKDEDWHNKETDTLLENGQTQIEKLTEVDYYIISGRLSKKEAHWLTQLFGDILVHPESAREHRHIKFSPQNCYEFPQTNHFKIQIKIEVYEKMKEWYTAHLEKTMLTN
ncbi:MAG: hypothetical protein SFU27_01690 [Thermonemataceae bacterium]|nr:hypothetical protein [Thermonemataceae bacterium]